MDTSFLAPGPVSWVQLVGFAAFMLVFGKATDWVAGRFKKTATEAVSPLTIDMAAVKIQVASVNDQLNAFKIEVARNYVPIDVITRLERRIDDMVISVREEMRETRDAMLRAFLEGRRPPG